MANKSKYVTIDAELEYPRVFFENRDMGNEKVDYSDTDGVYKVTLILDQDNMEKAVAAGCPEKQGTSEQFKAFTRDGNTFYRFTVRRPHLHPRFMALDEDGQPTDERLVVGPPALFDLATALQRQATSDTKGRLEDFIVGWTIDDGLIGNGSKARVKLKIESGIGVHGKAKGKKFSRVQLEGIGLLEVVEYEGAGSGGWV